MSLFKKKPQVRSHKDVQMPLAGLIHMGRFYLNGKTELAKNDWNFMGHKRWEMVQGENLLRFHFEDGSIAECQCQAVGSFNSADGNWMWAWGNESIDEGLKQIAYQCQSHGEKENIFELKTPYWPADMEWAWDMTAFATCASEAETAFCAQHGPLSMFFTLYNVKLIPKA